MLGIVITTADVSYEPVITEGALNVTLEDAYELYKSLGHMVGTDVFSEQLDLNARLSKFLVAVRDQYQIDICQCGGIINLANSQEAEAKMCSVCLTDATPPVHNDITTDIFHDPNPT